MRRTNTLAFRSLVLVAALVAMTGVANAAQGFSVTKLRDNVFTVMRTDPPGLAVESNTGFIECADYVIVVSSPTAARSTARCSTPTSPGRLSPTPGTIRSAKARHQSEHAPRNFQ